MRSRLPSRLGAYHGLGSTRRWQNSRDSATFSTSRSRNRPLEASIGRTMVTTVPIDLLEAAKAGDDWAVEALLEPRVDSAYRIAWAMLHHRAAAEDAVQEASLLAWRKIARLLRRRCMLAWIFTIVTNQYRRARRQNWWPVLKLPDR